MVNLDFELEPGQMVGEYRVERKIGEGAFGKVYAAVQPVIGKSVAIKVLNPALSGKEGMVARFASEARAVNQIRHRNIIDIFSFGALPNGAQYFVMELLQGMSFEQYLRKTGPLDPAFALSLLWPIGRALGAAHKAGIAHRDLKPENVFLVMDEDGAPFPKLLDFGIAKLMSDAERAHRTQTGMILGTPVYMSPEQCRAQPIDHRSDIYSFGIMTHEVLTGRRPFDAPTVVEVIVKHMLEPPPPMSSCRPGLPPALDAPVLRMLDKDAARRPQTMQAALDELALAARSAGIAAPTSIPPAGAPMISAGAGPSAAATAGQLLDTGAWLEKQRGQTGGAVQAMSAPGPQPSMGAPQPSGGVLDADRKTGRQEEKNNDLPIFPPSYDPFPGQLGHQPSMGAPQMNMAAPWPPPSYPQPAPAHKSNLPLVLGLGGAALLLVVLSAGFLMARAAFNPEGPGPGPSTSESDSLAVQIGESPPRVGYKLAQELDLVLSLDLTGCTSGRSGAVEVRQHRQYTITALAVNDWHMTQGEIHYGESFTSTRENKAPPQSNPDAVAGRAFTASSPGGDFSVVALDGSDVDDGVELIVKSDVGNMFAPRPEVFKHPLSAGDSLSLPPALAAALFGALNEDPNTATRFDNAVLRLTTIDRAQKRASFDTDFTIVQEQKQERSSFSGPIKGTLTLDIPTGRPVAGRLSGPLSGAIVIAGVRCNLKGLLNSDMKANVGN
jgi:serine/threonine protein kinase